MVASQAINTWATGLFDSKNLRFELSTTSEDSGGTGYRQDAAGKPFADTISAKRRGPFDPLHSKSMLTMKPLLRHVGPLILMRLLGSWGLCVASDFNSSLAPLSLAPLSLLASATVVGSNTLGGQSRQSSIQKSETTIMPPDIPPLSPQALPAIVMQMAATGKVAVPKTPENCWVVLNEKPAPGAYNSFNPVSFKIAKQLGLATPQSALPAGFYEIAVVVPPKHGRIVAIPSDSPTQLAAPLWSYEVNDEGYLGWDQARFLIKVKGREFQSVVTFRSVQSMPQDTDEFQALYRQLCRYDKAEKTSDASVWTDYQNNYPTEISPWFKGALVSAVLSMKSGVTYSFFDLSGASVGQTTGQGPSAQINLDPTAAGHGWYVDATPLDNPNDYLPTSNPNVCLAKAGSEAAGKMDMLSVLLHAYGHALSWA